MASSSQEGRRMERLTVREYFTLTEQKRPMELVYGVVREPPAPLYGHQSLLTGLTAMLVAHVKANGLGEVCVSPVDVVLDEAAALVVQPDIIFIARDRLHIVRDRVWGAPDLVVEVLSRGTARRDRTIKLGWYRQYGVGECWLIDGPSRSIDVIDLRATPEQRITYVGMTPMQSAVLSGWTAAAATVLT
jgi:Uma2 family endonuclease